MDKDRRPPNAPMDKDKCGAGGAKKGCSPACDMRGFLSFLILWLLNKKSMTGAELAEEIGRRKGGCKPNPGTIYPALKELVRKKAIALKNSREKQKAYALTPAGKAELGRAIDVFSKTFYDLFTR